MDTNADKLHTILPADQPEQLRAVEQALVDERRAEALHAALLARGEAQAQGVLDLVGGGEALRDDQLAKFRRRSHAW